MLPAYQIDFQAVASGKMIASSKRKVRWRFGFPNQQAMTAGRTGVDCRGEEHDIVIIWSVASGKRQVYMDGSEIHFSSSRAPIFQYSWSARGNHVIKVVAHASPPMSPTPGFRQYDLFIDGQSFFTMPKPYELNIRGQIPSHGMAHGSYGRANGHSSYSGVQGPSTREQEEADLQKAISASLQESAQFLAKKEDKSITSAPAAPPAPAVDLMDFGGSPTESQTVISYNTMPPSYGAQPSPQYASEPAASPYQPVQGYQYGYQQPAPPPQYQSAPVSSNALPYQSAPVSSNALVPIGAPPSNPYGVPPQGAYAAPPSQGPMYATAPAPAAPAYGSPAPPASIPTGNLFAPPPEDPFAPVAPPAGDPFGFGQPVPVDDPFAPKPPPQATRDDITNSILSAYGSQPQGGGQPQQQGHPPHPGQQMATMNGNLANSGMPSYNGGLAAPAPPPEKKLSEFEKAMKRLVNVDRIDEPAEQEYKLTIKKEEEKKTKDGRSKGMAPVATGLVGSNATLDQIKEVKPNTPKTGEGVMKAPPQLFHPDAAYAGALVVHGQGPPPIQRGFGVGFGSPPPNFQNQRW